MDTKEINGYEVCQLVQKSCWYASFFVYLKVQFEVKLRTKPLKSKYFVKKKKVYGTRRMSVVYKKQHPLVMERPFIQKSLTKSSVLLENKYVSQAFILQKCS